MEIVIKQVGQIAKEAGNAILTVYNDPDADFQITSKSDQSPLTLADRLSHRVITSSLEKIYPGIPVLSEEGSEIPYEIRKKWNRYWCVDPLDGTKEFIKRNGEFTVNIALIANCRPVMGVIYVPVADTLYMGTVGEGAWKIGPDGTYTPLRVNARNSDWVAVGSRSHASEEEAAILSKYPVTTTVSIGSSLKFCLIAEGKASIYLRQGPTMEWDTAAGQAIAESSGASMTTPDGQPFLYNKPSLLNGPFLCVTKTPGLA